MTKTNRVTAIVPCYNEENNLDRALSSIQWADEILVVDSFSKDNSINIAKKYTNRVLEHEYINSAAQKNWAIPQANNEWIFLLDADEQCTEELAREIKTLISSSPEHDAYWIKRKNHFMGKPIHFSGWGNDKVIRLFKRDTCKYQEKQVHAEIITKGSVGKLKNKINHFTYKNLDSELSKLDVYTTWGAVDRLKKYRKITMFHLALKPFGRFFRHYILNLGFLDGKQGFIIAMFSGYNVFIRTLKIWRIKEGESFSDSFQAKKDKKS